MNASSSSSQALEALTAEQKATIERNRQRAILIRQKKLSNLSTQQLFNLETKQNINNSDSKHTDGGFLIEDDQQFSGDRDTNQLLDQNICESQQEISCEKCEQLFVKSFLRKHFSVPICDTCKDMKDEHSLITRTEAKSEYLLKDCDFDAREPPLKFIAKKNPHQFARGDMRLYLRFQVEDRALEVWGSEQNLEEEREKRCGNRRKRKQKEYDKKMKNLRMSVRSSLYTKSTQSHVHQYGDERYNESTDQYEKTCETCAHLICYEKM